MKCQNNLKQIGLAIHNFHATHDTFPPGYGAFGDGLNDATSDYYSANNPAGYNAATRPSGQRVRAWRVHILPDLEQSPLYNQLPTATFGDF